MRGHSSDLCIAWTGDSIASVCNYFRPKRGVWDRVSQPWHHPAGRMPSPRNQERPAGADPAFSNGCDTMYHFHIAFMGRHPAYPGLGWGAQPSSKGLSHPGLEFSIALLAVNRP